MQWCEIVAAALTIEPYLTETDFGPEPPHADVAITIPAAKAQARLSRVISPV
jgi:hypothetical protein